jgi:hypothetical protein
MGRRGYTLRGDEKSPERIDFKRITLRALWKRACKYLRVEGLDQGDEFGVGATRFWSESKSRMKLGKHGRE